jgi:RES domain
VSGPGVPPAKLSEFGRFVLAKGTTLHRFCALNRPANAFNPCRGEPTRFAPLYVTTPAGRVCVPTLYVGETYEAAAFETMFRNLPPKPLRRQVFEIDFAGRGHARLLVNRDLILGPFFHQNLARIGQTRQSMIDTDATCYGQTVLWGAAVHESFAYLDGLVWTSRQHDRDYACVLFGDRATGADVTPIGAVEPIDSGQERARISEFARDYEIDIVPTG